MAKKLRVGVIGANWSLIGHLPAWRNLPDVEVTAICTAHEDSARKAAAEQGVAKAYWDYQAMMEDPELDIIDVGTRPSLRYDMVMRALAAGKHVLNANPFATDLAKAKEMLAAQRGGNLIGAVEAQFRWVPQISYIRQLIDEGFIGEFYGAACRCHYPLIRDGEAIFPFVTRPGYTTNYAWLGDPAVGASVLRNMGAHSLHALIYLCGPVQSVSATLETAMKQWRWDDGTEMTPKTVDTALLGLRFANGGVGQLNTSWAVPDGRGFALEIWGSDGRLRLESPSGFPDAPNTRLFGAKAAVRGMTDILERELAVPEQHWSIASGRVPTPPGTRVVIPLTRMFENFVDAVRGGGEALPSFADACHVQAICEAAEASEREGRRVAVAQLSP